MSDAEPALKYSSTAKIFSNFHSSLLHKQVFQLSFPLFRFRSMLLLVFIIFTEVCLTLQGINGCQISSSLGSFSVSQQMNSEQILSVCKIMHIVNQISLQ